MLCISAHYFVLLPARFVVAISLLWIPFLCCHAQEDNDTYGVDVSFPTHHPLIRSDSILGDNKQSLYDAFLQGCYDDRGREVCDQAERTRMGRNRNVPRSMVNFTTLGFTKAKCPTELYHTLKEFWDWGRAHNASRVERRPPAIITNTNLWASPTSLVDPEIHDPPRQVRLQQLAQSSIGPIVREWLGGNKDVIATRFYGIRVYQEGALFAPHMDLVPLIVGVIINVDQDGGLQEDWPFEVIAHNGQAHNVTLRPGEMVLFESHSVVHGRPFPLRGTFYANYNIHFELADRGFPDDEKVCGVVEGGGAGGSSTSCSDSVVRLPSYILEGSPEAERLDLMRAAREGDEMVFQLYVGAGKTHYLHERDASGWQPIHEAARAGHSHIVQYLLEQGGDEQLEDKTNVGETALWLAEHHLAEAEWKLARAKWKMDRLTETRDYLLKAREEREKHAWIE